MINKAKLRRMYVKFMRYTNPDHRHAIVSIADALGKDDSSIYRLVKTIQNDCKHNLFQPYKLEPTYTVCKKCWKEH